MQNLHAEFEDAVWRITACSDKAETGSERPRTLHSFNNKKLKAKNLKERSKVTMKIKKINKNLRSYLILWATQSLSTLGSAMTGYALVLWLYLDSGSALQTALLSVCSYAPYVIMSIFAGALSDRWDKKKTMLICDLLAALSTVLVFILIKTDSLVPWHLYLINAVSGLMNTVQQPP